MTDEQVRKMLAEWREKESERKVTAAEVRIRPYRKTMVKSSMHNLRIRNGQGYMQAIRSRKTADERQVP